MYSPATASSQKTTQRGSGQLETWLGEASFPPCFPRGSTWNPAHGKKARTGARNRSTEPARCCSCPPPAQRPSHQGGFGAGSAGHHGEGEAGQHEGSSLPSSSSLSGLCAFPLRGMSGAGRAWWQPAGQMAVAPGAPGPRRPWPQGHGRPFQWGGEIGKHRRMGSFL